MKEKYKILKKLPMLLPILYIYRIFEIIFTKPKKIKSYFSSLKLYKNENIERYQEHLNYVGLDYNFGNNKSNNK